LFIKERGAVQSILVYSSEHNPYFNAFFDQRPWTTLSLFIVYLFIFSVSPVSGAFYSVLYSNTKGPFGTIQAFNTRTTLNACILWTTILYIQKRRAVDETLVRSRSYLALSDC
jgi:hypothetical protein